MQGHYAAQLVLAQRHLQAASQAQKYRNAPCKQRASQLIEAHAVSFIPDAGTADREDQEHVRQANKYTAAARFSSTAGTQSTGSKWQEPRVNPSDPQRLYCKVDVEANPSDATPVTAFSRSHTIREAVFKLLLV